MTNPQIADETQKRELTEDELARRKMLFTIAMTIAAELAVYRLGCWRRARKAGGGPPLFKPAGKAGYTDGYRDGLADAAAGLATAAAT